MIKRESRSKLISFLVEGITFLVSVFPLYWIIVTALKAQMKIFSTLTPLWSENLTFEVFAKQLFVSGDTLRGFESSLIISCGVTTIATALTIPAAYDLACFRFGARKDLVLFFLTTQMLPSALVLTSLYIMFSEIRLLSTYWTPILTDATLGVPFSIIILRTCFVSILKELDEAVKINRCGHVSALAKVMLPIAKPSIVVTVVFSFVYAWGDLIYGATFITNPNMRPITSSIYNYVQQYQIPWNSTMVFGIIAISPVVLVFVFMQKYIVSDLTNNVVEA